MTTTPFGNTTLLIDWPLNGRTLYLSPSTFSKVPKCFSVHKISIYESIVNQQPLLKYAFDKLYRDEEDL